MEEGLDAFFSCHSYQIPTWYFKDMVIITDTEEVLKVSDVRKSNQGAYECEGSSSTSEVFYAKAYLYIKGIYVQSVHLRVELCVFFTHPLYSFTGRGV